MADRLKSRRGTVLSQSAATAKTQQGTQPQPKAVKNVDLRRQSVVSNQQTQSKHSATNPSIRMENSYCTEPRDDEKFVPHKARSVITNVVENCLGSMEYEPERCKKITSDLCNLIKSKIKEELKIPRYKIVCTVLIGENGDKKSGMRVASQCLWDQNKDNHASVTVTTKHVCVVATVYAIYYE